MSRRSIGDLLDRVYLGGAWTAGALLVILCGFVLYGIVARVLGLFSGGASDFAGYVMATGTFLALAYTFRSHGHIRVSLIISKFSGNRRRGLELACLAVMSAVVIFLAVYAVRLTYFSYIYGTRSEGADAVPLWIPQTPAALGAVLFAVAVCHTLVEGIVDPDTLPSERGEGGEGPEV